MNLPQEIVDMHGAFKQAGRQLYVVGGSIRDHILGLTPKDYDMATDAMPNEIEQILADYKLDFTGKSFGVIRVYTRNEPKGYEIATFRKDISVGRNPEVELGVTIDADVNRRDLTINALFYDIENKQVVDLVGGVDHLNNKIIMTPGEPADRFDEDRLRILRAIRFAARIGGTLHKKVDAAIRGNNSLDGLGSDGTHERISQERVFEEFCKGIFESKSVVHYLHLMHEFGLLQAVFPKLIVKDPIFIESRSIEAVSACLLYNSETRVKQILGARHLKFDCLFTEKIANGVIFLHTLHQLTAETAYVTLRARRSTSLSDVAIMEYAKLMMLDLSIVSAFVGYSVTTNGDELVSAGFSGAALGDEMRRIESIKFSELVKLKTV